MHMRTLACDRPPTSGFAGPSVNLSQQSPWMDRRGKGPKFGPKEVCVRVQGARWGGGHHAPIGTSGGGCWASVTVRRGWRGGCCCCVASSSHAQAAHTRPPCSACTHLCVPMRVWLPAHVVRAERKRIARQVAERACACVRKHGRLMCWQLQLESSRASMLAWRMLRGLLCATHPGCRPACAWSSARHTPPWTPSCSSSPCASACTLCVRAHTHVRACLWGGGAPVLFRPGHPSTRHSPSITPLPCQDMPLATHHATAMPSYDAACS